MSANAAHVAMWRCRLSNLIPKTQHACVSVYNLRNQNLDTLPTWPAAAKGLKWAYAPVTLADGRTCYVFVSPTAGSIGIGRLEYRVGTPVGHMRLSRKLWADPAIEAVLEGMVASLTASQVPLSITEPNK